MRFKPGLIPMKNPWLDHTQMPPLQEFRQECMAEFYETPEEAKLKEMKLKELAREYHSLTDTFDRGLCECDVSYRRLMAASLPEYRRSQNYALFTQRRLGKEAEKLGFNQKQWSDAIQAARHLDRKP